MQQGKLYEKSGAFYIRYRITDLVNGVPVRNQKMHRLVEKDDEFYSIKSKAVKLKAQEFMVEINKIEKMQRAQPEPLSIVPAARNTVGKTKDMRIVDFWTNVYLPYLKSARKKRTVRCYVETYESNLKEHFGDSTLRSYTTGQGTSYITSLSPRYGRWSIARIRTVASAIFSYAIAIDAVTLPMNPWRGVRNLGKKKVLPPTPHYTLPEALAILEALGKCTVSHLSSKKDGKYKFTPKFNDAPVHSHHDAQVLFAFTFFCGLRPGEAIALDWSDFSSDGYVSIRRALSDGEIDDTKTGEVASNSVARLPLIEPLTSLLRIYHSACNRPRAGWVFKGARVDRPMNYINLVNRVIVPCCEESGLQWKGLYAGRRGAGTMLAELTNGLVAAQELLRHKSLTTTADFYKKLTSNALSSGMKLLEDAAAKATKDAVH